MKALAKQELVLNTDLVKIYLANGEYQLLIKMSRGGWLEHEPFPGDLRGLISALTLATEVNAGKFFPRGMAEGLKSPAYAADLAKLTGSKS